MFEAFLLLFKDCFFDLSTVFRKVLEDLTFLGNTGVFLGFQIDEILRNVLLDWLELVVKTLDAVCFLLCQQVFKELHAIVPSLVLLLLISLLSLVLGVQLIV